MTDLRVWSVNCTAVKVNYKALPGDDLKPSLFFGLQITGSLRVDPARPRNKAEPRQSGGLGLNNSIHVRRCERHLTTQIPNTLGSNRVASRRHPANQRYAVVSGSPDHRHSRFLFPQTGRAARNVYRPGGELVMSLQLTCLGPLSRPISTPSTWERRCSRPLWPSGSWSTSKYICGNRISMLAALPPNTTYRCGSFTEIRAAEGISLGDLIRTRRLEGVRRDLALSSVRATPISAVSQRWGFTNDSSFARMFRANFGVSPSEWRKLARQAGR